VSHATRTYAFRFLQLKLSDRRRIAEALGINDAGDDQDAAMTDAQRAIAQVSRATRNGTWAEFVQLVDRAHSDYRERTMMTTDPTPAENTEDPAAWDISALTDARHLAWLDSFETAMKPVYAIVAQTTTRLREAGMTEQDASAFAGRLLDQVLAAMFRARQK
jgi:hypothetical protein